MSSSSKRRAYRGPALFSYGFRPFFLFGSIWAALSVPIWVWSFLGGAAGAVHRDWHVHEMLFGFLPAVVAGFLTTAVPNWTGRMPVIGRPLAGLIGLWLAGRLAMLGEFWFGPAAAVIDCAFLIVFAAVVWREVLAGRNWRNLPVCGLMTTLALANILFHLDPIIGGAGLGERLAVGVAIVLITLVGGRIIPSFTRNWMKARRLSPEPAVFGPIDQAALALSVACAAAWTLAPEAAATGVILLLAGAANLVRLARWRFWKVGGEALLWILHAGYAWLGLGLMLLGASRLTIEVPRTAGVHALTAGAIGVMTLAVMSRATRGHTGRPLTADIPTMLVYLAVLCAAGLRVAAPFAGALTPGLLTASAGLWLLAFGGFAVSYWSMLTGPRPAAAAHG